MPSLLYLTPVFSTAGAAASAICYNIGGVWIWRFHQTAISENSGKNAQIFVRRSTMLSKEKAMDGVHLFVLDLDGTVYLGDQPIKGSIEFVRELEAAKDRNFFFLPITPQRCRRSMSKYGHQKNQESAAEGL